MKKKKKHPGYNPIGLKEQQWALSTLSRDYNMGLGRLGKDVRDTSRLKRKGLFLGNVSVIFAPGRSYMVWENSGVRKNSRLMLFFCNRRIDRTKRIYFRPSFR